MKKFDFSSLFTLALTCSPLHLTFSQKHPSKARNATIFLLVGGSGGKSYLIGGFNIFLFSVAGKPSPTIKWWRGEKLIDSIDLKSGFHNARSNQLVITGLQRSDQHASFTCQASNNNISQPVSATTSIEIYCK